MTPVTFLDLADAEVTEAVDWYDRQQHGLGNEFLRELRLTLARIQAHPETWRQISARTRRCRLKRFPYAVIYQLLPEKILVVAVPHHSRKPGYWTEREI